MSQLLQRISFLALALGLTSQASAGFYDGNDLHNACSKHPLIALGYSMAIADQLGTNFGVIDQAGNSVQPKRFVCIPADVQSQQVLDVVCQWLKANPAQRHYPADVLSYQAMLDVWRCPK